MKRAVNRFLQLRKQMENEKGESGKKVSTSELLDWCRVLAGYGRQDKNLAKLDGKLPYPSVLLKSWEDHAEVEPLYRKALAVRRQTQGEDHPDTARGDADLASVLRNFRRVRREGSRVSVQ